MRRRDSESHPPNAESGPLERHPVLAFDPGYDLRVTGCVWVVIRIPVAVLDVSSQGPIARGD